MLLSFATLYALDSVKARTFISYTSVIITLCLFLGVITYHLAEFISKTKAYETIKEFITSLRQNRGAIEEDCSVEHNRISSVLTLSKMATVFLYYNLDSDSTY